MNLKFYTKNLKLLFKKIFRRIIIGIPLEDMKNKIINRILKDKGKLFLYVIGY